MSEDESKGSSFKKGFRAGQQFQKVNDLANAVAELAGKIDALIPAVERLKVLAAGWGAFGGLCATLIMMGIAIIVYLK